MGWGWPKCFRTYGHKMDREFAKARLSNGLGAKMTSNVCSKNEKGICKVRLRNWLGAKMFQNACSKNEQGIFKVRNS